MNVLTSDGVSTLWSKIKSLFLPKTGGTISGNLVTGTKVGEGDVTVNGVLTCNGNGVELYHTTTPFIDFHYHNDSADYNVRIRNNVSGGLQIDAPKLFDMVGPLKSSGGDLWITNRDNDIFRAYDNGIVFYKSSTFMSYTSTNILGNAGIGGYANAQYKLYVYGTTCLQGKVTMKGGLVVFDSDGKEHQLNLTKAIELGVFN